MSITEVMEKPFGPYPDAQILNPKKLLPSGRTPTLRNVELWCNNEPIGFDDTEFIIRAPDDSPIARHPVQFYGTLQIENIEWLSAQGLTWLETDLRERDERIHISARKSGLNLPFLLNSGMRISVYIQCEKTMYAQYLTSDRDVASLTIFAKESARRFRILSLRARTHAQSYNFLSRYHLWALLVTIDKYDSTHARTPIPKRNIDWVIDTYLSTDFRATCLPIERRIIEDPGNSIDNSDDLNFSIAINPVEAKRRLTHARHIPRAEIVGLFAEHAEWLLAYMLAPATSKLRIVNIRAWAKFCVDAAQGRAAARRAGKRWGVSPLENEVITYFEDEDDTNELNIDLSRFGEDCIFWRKKLLAAVQPGKRKKTKPQRPIRTQSPSFHYDPDFSEASTASYTTSPSRSPTPPPNSIPIPPFLLCPPSLPTGRLTWHCPSHACDYIINLLHLTPENTKGLPQNAVEELKGKTWNSVRELPVQRALEMMVSRHYEEHLKDMGIMWRARKGGDIVVERILGKGTEGKGEERRKKSKRVKMEVD